MWVKTSAIARLNVHWKSIYTIPNAIPKIKQENKGLINSGLR